MNKTLRVSKDLELPLEIVTQRNAILAMSGAGKSNTAVVLAEEMSAAGVPWIAIDPKGDWWGVRSSRDGKGAGLRVPVFGGEHGDVPLSAKSGARMAELVATGKVTGVFDVSEFDSKADLVRFLTDFASTLLQRLRTPLHVFMEECDEYLPQVVTGEYARCVGAWKKLAKRGRFRGLGYTMISQRSAAVNKDVLYQCGTLIVMRVFGKRDRDAIKGWLEQSSEADAVVKTLAELEAGEAWVCSPQALKLMKRVHFRRRETYDSGRTPEIGEAFVVPKLAEIDLDALRAEMAEHDAPPELVGDDADLLLEQNRALRAQVAELEARPPAPAVSEEQIARLETAVRQLHETGIAAVEAARGVMAALPGAHPGERTHLYAKQEHLGALARLQPTSTRNVVHRDAKPAKSNGKAVDEFSPPPPAVVHQAGKPAKALAPNAPPAKPPAEPEPLPGMTPGESKLLVAIAQHGDGTTRDQLTVMTGYKRSYRDLCIQKLTRAGLIEVRGLFVHATDKGRKTLPRGFKPLPTGRKLREHWLTQLPQGERTVFEALVAAHPKWLSREAIDAATGYARSFRDLCIQKLKRRRLAVDAERGGVKASDELF